MVRTFSEAIIFMPAKRRWGDQQSGNHLLNFQYEERRTAVSSADRPAPSDPRQRVDATVLKRAFILQTFHFVLKREALSIECSDAGARRPLESYLHDHDALVPWEWIKAVVWKAPFDDFQCPICLEPPTAPRMTSCGHIFCFACSLRHLNNQKAKRLLCTCPVCHAFSVPSLLKPCILQPIEHIRVGSSASFTLAVRESSSALLVLRDDKTKVESIIAGVAQDMLLPPFGSPSADCGRYSVATDELDELLDVMDCSGIEEKLEAYRAMPRPFCDDDSYEFDALSEALSRAKAQCLEPCVMPHTTPGKSASPPLPSTPIGRVAGCSSAAASSASLPRVSSSALAKAASSSPPKMIEMFRASNGQQVYLHFLNVKMLKDDSIARGGIPMPSKLQAKVLELTTVTQTEETRTTFRALAHVPLYASYQLALVDLSHVVLPATLMAFKTAIDRRLERLASIAVEGSGQAAADEQWERYKSDRLAVCREWGLQRTPGVSPEMAPQDPPIPDLDSLPSLELPSRSPPTAASGSKVSNDGSNRFSDNGPSDTSVEMRQRATKRDAAAVTLQGSWGQSPGTAAAQLFVGKPSSATPTTPNWGKKPFTAQRVVGDSSSSSAAKAAPQRVIAGAASSSATSQQHLDPVTPPPPSLETPTLSRSQVKHSRRGGK